MSSVKHCCSRAAFSLLILHPAPPACCRTFCTLDFHPKDAEELVSEASKTFQLAPNSTTLRTLDKIWAAHDQMYG